MGASWQVNDASHEHDFQDLDSETMMCGFLRLQAKDHIGKSRRMKNPEKLAASKKKPLVARYILGGRVLLTRDPQFVEEYN